MYSISGGIICFLFMSAMSLFIKENRMWVVSVFGAIGHNIGQIVIACFIMGTFQIIWYLPILMISAIITGTFTGVAAQTALKHMRKTGIISKILEDRNYA